MLSVEKKRELVHLGWGAAVGLAYGLFVLLAGRLGGDILPAMSVGFLFALPLAMGFITMFLAERKERHKPIAWLIMPIFPVVGGALINLVFGYEGMICVVMFLPIGIGLSFLGGVAGGLIGRHIREGQGRVAALCVAFLPLALGQWEIRHLPPEEIRTTSDWVDIEAPADVVWSNIERVRRIDAKELPQSWSHRIGFPDPVEATLSYEGVGGVRHATFAGGILFIETVDVWEPGKRLAFSIHADTPHIPNTTLDQHVTVGGQYFDVLRGEYRLEALGAQRTRLHLASQQRVSTNFNWYADLWAEVVMKDLQDRILQVITHRCQAQR